MANTEIFEAPRRGRKPLNLTETERQRRNLNLREARKARLLASIPGSLDDLPDNYPLSFDMLLPVAGLPFSRAWVYQLIRLGRFPSTVKLSDNRVAWLAGDIRRHLAARTGATVYKAVQS